MQRHFLAPSKPAKRLKTNQDEKHRHGIDRTSGTPFLVLEDTGYISTENPCHAGQPSSSLDDENLSSLSYDGTDFEEQSLSTNASASFSTEDDILQNYSERIAMPKNLTKKKNLQRQPMKAPFSKQTPCFSNETPIILATARHSGSTIQTSCNRESIKLIQNQGYGRSNITSSAYFTNSRTSTTLASRSFTNSTDVNQNLSRVPGSLRHDNETEDVIAVTDVGQVCSVDRIEDSSLDSQCFQRLSAAKAPYVWIRERVKETEQHLKQQATIYMAVVWQLGKLGVAYYDVDTTCIHAMLDKQENDNFLLLAQVIKEISPVQIVMSSKQDERLIQAVKGMVANPANESLSEQYTNCLQFLPSIDFAVEMCKRRVLSMDLASVPNHYTDSERTLYMSSLVPFENISMVRALGGLLKFLEKMRIGIELEEAGTKLPVLDVKIFSVEEQMILDDTAYSALQIFHRESHPSVYKTGTSNGGKEGLSLFGIMNRTRSKIGSQMLRTWFQRPLKSLSLIRSRHDAVDFFNNPKHMELVSTLEDSLKYVKNITRILTRMKQSHVSVGDWQALYKTVYSATSIKEVCSVQPQTIPIFKKVTDKFTDELNRVTNQISRIVDFPESSLQGRFVVQPHVDERLDNVKHTYDGLPDFMFKVAEEELKKLGDEVTECTVLYMPQVGYLLAIPESALNNVTDSSEGYLIDGLEFMFSSNFMLHYRSEGTKELDVLLGDTRCDITDMETTIMHKLQDSILEHTDVLLAVLDISAELDCLLSLAVCAREYGYVRPTMTEENIIEVHGGRHPIQEMCCSTFVPNDIHSDSDTGQIKVLTGPNACGKSVYLKQVALIVFMAQIGSFVPAESAILGLIDRIFTRVSSLESVSIGLSTFMIDINQMSDALRNAGKTSLCVVDEFGKGTDMIDGVSLLVSCLQYWLNKADCPHVFVCTHFHSIIHQHLLPRTPLIKYMTLETLHNGDDLVFLYQLVEGHTNSSYACHVAAQAGLPSKIVKRGIEASDLIRQCKPIQRIDTVGTDTQYKRCTEIVDKFNQLNLASNDTDVRAFLRNFVIPAMEGKL